MEVTCSQCGKAYRKIPPNLQGKRIRCRECQALVPIPNSTEKPSFDGGVPLIEDEPPKRKATRKTSIEPIPDPPLKSAQEFLDQLEDARKGNKQKKRKKKKEEEWTLQRVFAALCLATLVVGWALMAGRYAKDHEGWIPGVVQVLDRRQGDPEGMTRVLIIRKKVPLDYLTNAVAKIPRTPQVLWYVFTEAWGIPLGILITFGILFGGFHGAAHFEQKLKAEDKRRRRAGI